MRTYLYILLLRLDRPIRVLAGAKQEESSPDEQKPKSPKLDEQSQRQVGRMALHQENFLTMLLRTMPLTEAVTLEMVNALCS